MMTVRAFLLVAALGAAMPASAAGRQPIEPIDVPASIEQGLDMLYVDREMAPSENARDEQLADLGFDDWKAAPVDLFLPVHPIYTELRRALVKYQMDWGGLPDINIPAGAVLKVGVADPRVSLLRQRLGLGEGTSFDEPLAAQVRRFQAAHGLKADGIVGAGTLDVLNRGSSHYEKVLMLNMERARRLPRTTENGRYILVDAGAAQLYMYENGKVVDQMKTIVGSSETETPMMVAKMQYISVNPEWNVPPELARTLIAPNVLKQGLVYLTDRDYRVYSSWEEDAVRLDPAEVDWKGIASGKVTNLRLVRGPGPWNSMGDMKFMMPNDLGIYLHDVPDGQKDLFAKSDRWISNGCVRLEDAERLAKWVFGSVPKGQDPKVEEDVSLPQSVPVYMTYLTAEAGPDGPRFRPDPYKRDAALIAKYFGGEERVAAR